MDAGQLQAASIVDVTAASELVLGSGSGDDSAGQRVLGARGFKHLYKQRHRPAATGVHAQRMQLVRLAAPWLLAVLMPDVQRRGAAELACMQQACLAGCAQSSAPAHLRTVAHSLRPMLCRAACARSVAELFGACRCRRVAAPARGSSWYPATALLACQGPARRRLRSARPRASCTGGATGGA
jgi:hypothetical protein